MKKVLNFIFIPVVAVMVSLPGDVYPDDAGEVFDQAFEYMKKGRYPEALSQYERAIILKPDSQNIWMEYAVCLRRLKRFQKAAVAGWRALELGPETAGLWGNLGNIFVDCRHWDAAKEAYKKAESLSDDKKWAVQNYLNLGYRQWLQGDYKGALDTFNHALKIDDKNGLTLLDIGVVHGSMGETEKAIKEIEEAVVLLEKEKNAVGLKYAQGVLEIIRRDNIILPNNTQISSYQVLPSELLTQPKKNRALQLKILDTVERILPVGDSVDLIVTTPEDWLEALEEDSGGALFNLQFEPQIGKARFRIIVSLFRSQKEMDGDALKEIINENAAPLLENSIEKKLSLNPLSGKQFSGYYYTLRDKTYDEKNDDPNEYPYLTQGIGASQDMLMTFTILTRDRGKEIDRYLDIIRTIRFK